MALASSNQAGDQHDESSQQNCNPRQEAEGFVTRSGHANIFLHRKGESKWRPKDPPGKQIRIIGTNSKRNNELEVAKGGRELAADEFVPKIEHCNDSDVFK